MRSGRGVASLAAAGALAAAVSLNASAPAASAPDLRWTEYLPPRASPSQTRPNRVAHCRRAKLACVRFQIRRMRGLQRRLGCDHRAVFATTYLELTREVLRTLRADPGFFRFRRHFLREDALFGNVYFRTLRAWRRGDRVADAWRIAFEAAAERDLTAAQDMLLGINAHVQNDMPFVLAALGLRDRAGASRKIDHDAFNAILNSAYEPVIAAVARYDPSISLTNPSWHPVEDLAGLELVRAWREVVWRNAERLVQAGSEAEWAQAAAEIEANAAGWARGFASAERLGHREARDAYCRARSAAEASGDRGPRR